jgi:hypothetical protein
MAKIRGSALSKRVNPKKSKKDSQQKNRAFKKAGLSYAGSGDSAKQQGLSEVKRGLRGVNQPPAEDILAMNDTRSHAFLLKPCNAVLARTSTFRCWACGEEMQPVDEKLPFCKQVFRCYSTACKNKKPRLHDPEAAFTPLYGFKKSGNKVQYKGFIRSAYGLGGMKAQNDAIGHLVRTRRMSLRQAHHLCDKFLTRCRVAMAYAEHVHGKSLTFENDIVDQDSGSTSQSKTWVVKRPAARPEAVAPDTVVMKKPAGCYTAPIVMKKPSGASQVEMLPASKGTTFAGRLLVFKARLSKSWSVQALLPKTVSKAAPLPPEEVHEVSEAVKQKMGKNTLAGIDGGHALRSSNKKAGAVALEGVKHSAGVFTPLITLQKKELSATIVSFLHKEAGKKDPLVFESARQFKVPGGDNAAESVIGHVNNSLRRIGLKGRDNKGGKSSSINSLAAAYLLRRPGFGNLLKALSQYRQACASGTVKVHPKDAFKHDPVWMNAE